MACSVWRFNPLQASDEKVNAAAAEVLNQYQRRADLIPNLVNTVKAYTKHEESLLLQVTEARSKAGAMHIQPSDLANESQAKPYLAAQSELGTALSKLYVAVESYPDLKASPLYQDLLVQLEGSENRITVARGRYIGAVQEFNTRIRQFPDVLFANVLGYTAKPQFSVKDSETLATPPVVDFQ